MKVKNKHSLFSVYIDVGKIFFAVAVFLLLAFWLVCGVILPDERDVVETNSRIFEGEWQQVFDNGERVQVDLPGKVKAEYGEVITLATTLPEDIKSGENICFRTIWQDLEIYIDGELRQSYTTRDSRLFGINSAMRYTFVELTEEDAGKELIYKCVSDSKYTGDVRPSYLGDRLSIWSSFLEESGIKMLITFFLLLMSVFCILVCVILKFVYKKTLSLIYLAWTIFFCAFWMVSEIEFRQIIFRNVSLVSYYTYWCLMIIPLPLLIYLNDIQGGYYKKVYFVSIVYSIITFITGTALQVLDIEQFTGQLPFIHAGILMAILSIIVTIIIDVFKKRISEYLFVGIGLCGMLFTAILEMILYYIGADISLGTVLAVGLLFLLIMAIIKTGQDLFISEQKRQQAILAREAQAKFLANMSHEIRTPINAIIGMNEMILRENEDEAIQDYAHNIKSASNMLLGLVNDVLDFSKIESGQLELIEDTYSFAALVQDEMLLLKERASNKPISTQLIIDKELPSKLYGDELRIKQVLTNLLSNAVKYTKEGEVILKAYFKQLDDETIELIFSVTDTGIGIRKEDLSQLFDSFKRLELNKNRNIQGTGLGLNIAKQLVDSMNGTITVESEYGKGSTFTVSIPQRVIDSQPVGNLEESLEKYRKESQVSENVFIAPDATILIVDDNSMNLSLMKGLLKRTKMQVDTAISGKECLKITKTKRYDIIFMDHMMPEMDGVETLNMLRADQSNPNCNACVIALTANAIAGCREMYLGYGFNDYFAKPIQADKLEKLLMTHLSGDGVDKNSRMMKQGATEGTVGEENQKTSVRTEDTTIENPKIENSTIENSKIELGDVDVELTEIDHKMGLSYCMDSEDFYKDMLVEFCRQSQEYLPQLEECFKKRDWKQYAIIAHGLKSNSLNIGAANFSKLSLKHEQAGKSEDSSFIIEEYDRYVSTLRALMKKIEEM